MSLPDAESIRRVCRKYNKSDGVEEFIGNLRHVKTESPAGAGGVDAIIRNRDHLESFANNLAPSSEESAAARFLFDLLRLIALSVRGSVDRAVLAGSLGKKTNLKHADMDIVFFLNLPAVGHSVEKYEKERTAFLNAFRAKLAADPEVFTGFRQTPFSVQFAACGLFDVDALPAVNFSQCLKDQLAAIRNQGAGNPSSMKAYYTSMDEGSLQFMAGQSARAHSVCRLAKLWAACTLNNHHFKGKSSTFELIAVLAAMKCSSSASCLDIFRQFLSELVGIASMREPCIRGSYFTKGEIPGNIRNATPLLMDILSPYNNRLDPKDVDQITLQKIASKARDTLDRL